MKMMKSLLGAIVALASTFALSEYTLNMTEGVTSVSQNIYGLHMTIFWIVTAIGIVVFGAMAYSIYHHRQSRGAKAAHFHESTTVELLWTAIPVVILIVMAIPATRVLIDLENTDNAEMTLKITGHQWKWQYDYIENDNFGVPKEGITIMSNLAQSSRDAVKASAKPEHYLLDVDNRIVLPVDTRIRFLMTSNDVIHNWWVPAFGVKQDGNPGFINDAWAKIDQEGTYRGQCAELCGKDHGFMPIVVDVVSKEKYKAWVSEQKAAAAAAAASASKTWSKDELMAKGEQVYNANCAGCHQKNGQGMPPVFPSIVGSSIANGPASDHINLVLHGKGSMPAFKMLGDADIASVLSFQRQSWGNTGTLIQPSDVKSAR
ncbi:MAG: cytochrome c oxidase subunit II [Gammaproteobacteria bacterium]|nr:cytochrome c oxidase subunit II [Gammaproteobacteria bacterium]